MASTITSNERDSSLAPGHPDRQVTDTLFNEYRTVINANASLLDEKASTAYIDAKVANQIANGVTTIAPSQDAVFDALATKSPILTIDAAPTNGSTNPVQSNGVFDSITGVYSDMALKLTISDFVWGEIPSGTINGTNDTFTIANADPSQIAVYSDGIRTSPVNFSVTGTTLVMGGSVIPSSSLLIDCIK